MILFTAAHHSREALSLSMIFNIFLLNLKSLIHKTPRGSHSKRSEYLKEIGEEFWNFNYLIFVPAVNLDGVIAIDEGFHLNGVWDHKMVRKNMRHTSDREKCLQGVDINRNYDIAWESMNDAETIDPCSEVFRGEKPFSEPETKAIAHLVENLFP